jgi:hypothetical protein
MGKALKKGAMKTSKILLLIPILLLAVAIIKGFSIGGAFF